MAVSPSTWAQRSPLRHGGRDGTDRGTMLRARRASGDGRRLRARRRGSPEAEKGGTDVWHQDTRADGDARLAARQRLHARRHGSYWKPVYAVLEDAFDLIVGNAHHIKNVPGRKTDVKDSEWIADLLRHGLIARSFVPPKPIRELRDLLRYRRKLVESRTDERNRLQKLLETANIKLASVASDVFGISGMAMLKALVRGDSTPQEMAQLAKRRLRQK